MGDLPKKLNSRGLTEITTDYNQQPVSTE